MNDVFAKIKARKTVFQRTKAVKELPKEVLYLEWIAGQGSRRVVDTDGQEHVLDDEVLQSRYKLVTGAKAKKLIDAHWQSFQLPKSPS